jgi:MHS family proline/betaine transporter-like MFS transporter
VASDRFYTLNYDEPWKSVITVGAFALFQNVALYVVLTFVPSHMTESLGQTSLFSSASAVVTMTAVCITIPVAGALSDKVGRKRVLGASCVSAAMFAFPLFLLMEQGNAVLVIVSYLGLGIILGVFLGPVLAAMNELFTTSVRYGGFSLGYNLSVSLFGGTAPFMVTLLVAQTGITAAPGLYVIAAALITFFVLIQTKESAPRRDLNL